MVSRRDYRRFTLFVAVWAILQGRNDTKASPITQVMNNSARFDFKTCGSNGRSGPTEYQCRAAYESTNLKGKVQVLTEPQEMRGVQVWIVPETRLYSITALGASGGTGLKDLEPSNGAYASANFNLTKGEKIYMLIGQMGQSACSDINRGNSLTKNICMEGISQSGGQPFAGGGGGGGGGTFVFKKDQDTQELIPLIIAAGGGGKSYKQGNNAVRADGGLSPPGSGLSANTPDEGAGAGGGWDGFSDKQSAGFSLLRGGLGGKPCEAVLNRYEWQVYGGFGGGGGGCTAGGGGGGYSGGNVSVTDDPELNGQGGSSYISPLGSKAVLEPGVPGEGPNGVVQIEISFPCACAFMCVYHNLEENKFKCYCPPNHILADDGVSCIDTKVVKPETTLTTKLFIIVGTIVIVVIAIACIVCVHFIRSKRSPAPGLGIHSRADEQLNWIRLQVGVPSIMSEYNPNYDFGGTKCTLQDLQEVPRSRLTLVRGLGQGAFGEVYQGYLSNNPREPCELPVAVKTLPALSTDQAEMDFLMEALIMSKFHHANIVRFIGVCFEKHPRFIILELLEGGDLKTFLRDSRPKPDQPSRVTMVDLVKLSLDVAKGCQYLEENHFIHRDIAARNCLLTSKSSDRVAKIADFGMARDIYRADYYRKGGKAMLPVKWMPPEAFLDGIFTSKTDVWSFGILLWEVFSLGYMPYPGRGNQEVMHLVTAGGRLEPPDNCPLPVYHIMNICWHGIPERRPTFTAIIESLQKCLQDPEVIHSPLPVFRRPPSIERDATIMRPRDSDRMVLTVDAPVKYLEPGSPNSMDQLIGPQSPDIDDLLLRKKPNLRASAESMDELLRREELQGAAPGARDGRPQDGPYSTTPNRHFAYQRVWDYDRMGDAAENAVEEALEVQALAEEDADAAGGAGGGGGGTARIRVPEERHHHGASSRVIQYPREECVPNNKAADEESAGDSGKSSLENMSQTDVSSSQVSGNASPTEASASAAFSLTDPVATTDSPRTRHADYHSTQQQQTTGTTSASAIGVQTSNSKTEGSVVSTDVPTTKIRPGLYANSSANTSGDPWERRQVDNPQLFPDVNAATPATPDPCYINIEMGMKCLRKDTPSGHLPAGVACGGVSTEAGGNTGVHGSRPVATYRSQRPTVEDEVAGQDPGDSGVVIDLKGSNTSSHNQHSNGQTWL